MKTTFFLAAVLFISTASFAQSSVHTDAAAQASIKSNLPGTASKKAEQGTKKAVKTVVKEKKAVEEQLASDLNTAKKAAEHNPRESVSAGTELSTGATVKSNNSPKEASMNEQSNGSGAATVNLNAEKLNREGKSIEQATTNSAAKADAGAKSAVKSLDTKAEAKAKSIKQSVKPKPASVKVNTHIAAVAGIKIK